jgi:hypothetical protein
MSDYVNMPKLEPEAVAQLVELYREINPPVAKSHRVRMGMNIGKVISHYRDTRWFRWTAKQRKLFKDLFGNRDHVRRGLVGYFLGFPANDGFLDVMDTWADQGDRAAVIVAYALFDGQSIWLNGERIILQAGEGIAFRISVVHEVKRSKLEAVWANTMVLGNPADYA